MKKPAGACKRHCGNGICLTGGGALLYGMDKFVAEHTKVPCHVAEDPHFLRCNRHGKVLDNIDKGFVNALYDYRRGDYFGSLIRLI